MDKTHYRKAFNSPYLSSADIVEPTVLTVKHVKLEPDKSKKTKDSFNTAYFDEVNLRPGEPLKPMILNAHNSKIMANLGESKFIDDWQGIKITVYVDVNVKFGRDTVEGLRINPNPPKVRQQLEPNTPNWGNAIKAFVRDGNLQAVMSRMDISDENIELIKAEAVLLQESNDVA